MYVLKICSFQKGTLIKRAGVRTPPLDPLLVLTSDVEGQLESPLCETRTSGLRVATHSELCLAPSGRVLRLLTLLSVEHVFPLTDINSLQGRKSVDNFNSQSPVVSYQKPDCFSARFLFLCLVFLNFNRTMPKTVCRRPLPKLLKTNSTLTA